MGNRRDEAADLFSQALAIYRDLGSSYGEALALSGLGTVAHRARRDEQAIGYYQQVLDIALKIRLPDSAGSCTRTWIFWPN